jgi:hypothetical protein
MGSGKPPAMSGMGGMPSDPQSDLDGDKASGQPDARQIRVPAISAGPDDDIEDIIDPRWRR